MCDFLYYNIKLIFDATVPEVSAFYLQGTIEDCLRQVFGEISGCSEIVLFKFSAKKEEVPSAAVRCVKSFGWKLHAALTLISKYQDVPCKLDVVKTTPAELGLTAAECED